MNDVVLPVGMPKFSSQNCREKVTRRQPVRQKSVRLMDHSQGDRHLSRGFRDGSRNGTQGYLFLYGAVAGLTPTQGPCGKQINPDMDPIPCVAPPILSS